MNLPDHKPYENYVQDGKVDGRVVSSKFFRVSAGPPRLTNLQIAQGAAGSKNIAYPIGVLQSVSLGQNMSIQKLFEIGSQRSYQIPGHVNGQLSLSRVHIHGPNLLRAMWAYYQDALPPALVEGMLGGVTASANPNPHNVKVPPGYENVFWNLASDLFTQPIGILLEMRDNNENVMGAVYVEECLAPNFSFSTSAQGVAIQENISFQYERLIPIKTQLVGLVK